MYIYYEEANSNAFFICYFGQINICYLADPFDISWNAKFY